MSAAPDEHGQEQSERLFLYAVQALPSSEVPGLAAHISVCAECRQELEALRPVIDSFSAWPTDVLRPSGSVWTRLAQRIAAETGGDPLVPAPSGWIGPEWTRFSPGIFCKVLAVDPEQSRVSMLVRLAPRTEFPSHRHHGVEELYLLHGELIVNDETFSAGDYRRAEAGTVDHNVWSENGCTCLLMSSVHDVLG